MKSHFITLSLLAVLSFAILLGISCLFDTTVKPSTTASFTTQPLVEDKYTINELKDNSNISIWTDPETGVQYIIYSKKAGYAGYGGITPRLNADGSLYVVDPNT